MQFVRNGPDIPERLLQAHEDGHVVFFCGAGISRPADLPDFRELVGKLYHELSDAPSPAKKSAISARQFDTAIGLLEKEVGRNIVRERLASILTPKLGSEKATATHRALLALGTCRRSGQTRIVTTNFDRLFERVIDDEKDPRLERFKAPLLPVPKTRWNGLVYLHGLLSDAPTRSELEQLVLSSGDFGLAYLTERWAARFVSELFRNYTVCFVGYGINDPVLRYMTDALAADRLRGEASRDIFAFGSYPKGKKQDQEGEWDAKNVIPILYPEHRKHAYLHRTLEVWAESYRDGISGKEGIIDKYAGACPLQSTQEDDYVGRVLWALSDPSGIPARRFAEQNPVPSLEWLKPLSANRYGKEDLSLFGVPASASARPSVRLSTKEPSSFSQLRRPAPYQLAPPLCLVDDGVNRSVWDKPLVQLAHWLTYHVNDPKLLHWVAKEGGELHPFCAEMISQCLIRRAGLNEDALRELRARAPNAIPNDAMRTLWQLALSGRLASRRNAERFWYWRQLYPDGPCSATARMALREHLSPRVCLKHEPYARHFDAEGNAHGPRPKDIFATTIVLATPEASELPWTSESLQAALPHMLDDLSALLREALDLMRELGTASETRDGSHMQLQSIAAHHQNRPTQGWAFLIELTRDAWLRTKERDVKRAALTAEMWSCTPYPVFRRLALFAATHADVISGQQALEWLLADSGRWLWSPETTREAIRLLIARARDLDANMLERLQDALLDDTSNAIKDGTSNENTPHTSDWNRWLRLKKVASTGVTLNAKARKILAAISRSNPHWKLALDESDEFPFWIGDTEYGDDEPISGTLAGKAPKRGVKLLEWLRQYPEQQPGDGWDERCKTHFATAANALCALAQAREWLTARWGTALYRWGSDERRLKRLWHCITPVLAEAPVEQLDTDALKIRVAWWLLEGARTVDDVGTHFFTLSGRMLDLNGEGEPLLADEDPVQTAINHPVGIVTDALLQCWLHTVPKDGEGLPQAIKALLTRICDSPEERFRHGRALLALHAVALFRGDGPWAKQYLKPHFAWQRNPDEAASAWKSLLFAGRVDRTLMEALKADFLDAARHFDALGPRRGTYAHLLTSIALEGIDVLTKQEAAAATRTLPEEGLRAALFRLEKALSRTDTDPKAVWEHRVAPYFKHIWPNDKKHRSPSIAHGIGDLCISAGDAFPIAFRRLRRWLDVHFPPDSLVYRLDKSGDRLNEKGLCEKFPNEALAFLDVLIKDEQAYPPPNLKACLDAIQTEAPDLASDPRFKRLQNYWRRYRQE